MCGKEAAALALPTDSPIVPSTSAAQDQPAFSANPAISAPPGTATLSLLSEFASSYGRNPLTGVRAMLLNDSPEDLLVKAGFQVPAGTPAFRLLTTTCQNPQSAECQRAAAATFPATVAMLPFDATGKAQFARHSPGRYYLVCAVRVHNPPIQWRLKVDLKPGSNSVTLDQRNALQNH